MECFPACVACSGLCKREPAEEVIAGGRMRKTKPYAYPREPYIKLECGHFTDAVEQSVMRTLDTKHMLKAPRRKKGGLLYCSNCEEWTGKYVQAIVELPEEPIF